MERRFGSSGWVSCVSFSLVVAALSAGSFGCARNRAVAPSHGEGALPVDLVRQAREFSGRGESHRAEQYFLAALDAGASPEKIYPELIDACIRGGRLGSASVHVDKRLRERPDDLDLLRLSISLEEGLGHEKRALARAEQLTASPLLIAEQQLFLAGYFERAGQTNRALEYFHLYMQRRPESERPAWVAEAVSRLESSGKASPVPFESSSDKAAEHD